MGLIATASNANSLDWPNALLEIKHATTRVKNVRTMLLPSYPESVYLLETSHATVSQLPAPTAMAPRGH
jgi:hypothetical protein